MTPSCLVLLTMRDIKRHSLAFVTMASQLLQGRQDAEWPWLVRKRFRSTHWFSQGTYCYIDLRFWSMCSSLSHVAKKQERNCSNTFLQLFTTIKACGCAYSGVCIYVIVSASLPSKFHDLALRFPAPNSFPRTLQVLEILQTQFHDFTGGVGPWQ